MLLLSLMTNKTLYAKPLQMTKHYLITRFSVRYSQLANPKSWLEKRLELFHRYTLPCIKNQTDQNFTWLLLIAPNTPIGVRTTLKNAAENIELLEIPDDYIDPEMDALREHTDLYTHIAKHITAQLKNTPATRLITTRTDSDDVIAHTFIENIKKHATLDTHKKYVIDMLNGAMYSTRTRRGKVQTTYNRQIKKRRNSYKPSQFISLVEPLDADVSTVYCNYHCTINDSFKVITPKAHELQWCWLVENGTNWTTKRRHLRKDRGELIRSNFPELQ